MKPWEAISRHTVEYVVLHPDRPWENIKTGKGDSDLASGAFQVAGILKSSVITIIIKTFVKRLKRIREQ